jgi:hypothetical protein
MQHGIRIAKESSEQMTPRRVANLSAGEFDAPRIDVAEMVYEAVLLMGEQAPAALAPGSLLWQGASH